MYGRTWLTPAPHAHGRGTTAQSLPPQHRPAPTRHSSPPPTHAPPSYEPACLGHRPPPSPTDRRSTDPPPAPHTPPTDLFHVKPGQAANPHPGCPPETTQSFRPRPARTPGTRPTGPSPHPDSRQGHGEGTASAQGPSGFPVQVSSVDKEHRKHAETILPRRGVPTDGAIGPPPPAGTVREPPPQETAPCGHELTVWSVASDTIRRYDRATCEASTQQRYFIDIKRSPTRLP